MILLPSSNLRFEVGSVERGRGGRELETPLIFERIFVRIPPKISLGIPPEKANALKNEKRAAAEPGFPDFRHPSLPRVADQHTAAK